MNRPLLESWRIRLCLALAAGLTVTATAYLCAWQSYRDYHYFRYHQFQTRTVLEFLRDEIDRHGKVTGKLPQSLKELEWVRTEKVPFLDDQGIAVDAWNRPVQYRLRGEEYDVFSLGRDGQLGGNGLDADLFPGKASANEFATFWQFATELDSGGMLLACILAGIITVAICFLASSELHKSIVATLVAMSITAFFALITAVAISMLHLPSGH